MAVMIMMGMIAGDTSCLSLSSHTSQFGQWKKYELQMKIGVKQ